MRYLILALALLLGPAMSAQAQVQTSLSVGVVRHGVSIGFTISNYPTMARVPGYPVYYAPYADYNYFFYDGLYWVFVDDNWYASAWYDGPWDLISPYYVPVYILRIPVRYYHRPPPYFRGWRTDRPPRWGEHWGTEWEQRNRNWNRWDRRRVPAAAPLPSYQRHYSGSLYPQRVEQQRQIEIHQYRYQPRDRVSRQLLEQRRNAAPPSDRERQPVRTRSSEQERRQREVQNREAVRQQQQVRQTPVQAPPPTRQTRQQPVPQQRAPQTRSRTTEQRNEKRGSSRSRDKEKKGDDGGGHSG